MTGDSATSDPQPTADPRALDLVFSFHRLTWEASRPSGVVYAQTRVTDLLIEESPFRSTLVADHPSSAPIALARRLRGPRWAPPADCGVGHVTPLRLRRRDPDSLTALRRTYRRYGRSLERAADARGMRRPVLLTTNPFVAAFGELGWAGRVTHFATDDFSVGNRWSGHYAVAYSELARRGLPVAAVTAEILARIGSSGPSLTVPNGIDPEEWLEPAAAPAWFSALPGPRLLYVGGLMSRMDVGVLRALADAHPNGSIVLVGSLIDPEHFASLRAVPNVVVHGAVGRRDLRGIVGAADVGLVPHVVNAMTRAMSPLKAYEYLAAGLPVVATPLPELERLGPRVLTRPPEDFADGVVSALGLSRQDEDARRAFLRAHGWRGHYRELLRFAAGSLS